MCKVFNTLHLITWGSISPTSKKYFLHVQSIQYFAPIYLGVHISNFKKYFLHVLSIQYFAHKYLVVNIFKSKKYFWHVQSNQFSAPKYLGVNISNFIKILLARAKYSILCTQIPGGPYIQPWKNTSCTCKVFNTLHLNTWGSIYPNSKKYFLHMQSTQYFAPKYLGVHISNF